MLNNDAKLAIDNDVMNLPSLNLDRYLRLVLLLLMLAAQGIVNAHELGDKHSLDSHLCSTCVVGHGLCTALSVSYEAPQLQVCHALLPIDATTVKQVSRTHCHFARAPPGALGNNPNPN